MEIWMGGLIGGLVGALVSGAILVAISLFMGYANHVSTLVRHNHEKRLEYISRILATATTLGEKTDVIMSLLEKGHHDAAHTMRRKVFELIHELNTDSHILFVYLDDDASESLLNTTVAFRNAVTPILSGRDDNFDCNEVHSKFIDLVVLLEKIRTVKPSANVSWPDVIQFYGT